MSRVKNPQEKKRLSLDRDRRNVYTANDKASRKNIPRSKQLSHMRIRRAATQALAKVKGRADESAALESDALVKTRTTVLRNRGFRKLPDQPLRRVIEEQTNAWRLRTALNALKAAKIPLGNEVFIPIGDTEIGVRSADATRACEVLKELTEKSSWR